MTTTRKQQPAGTAKPQYWPGHEVTVCRTRILLATQKVFAQQGFPAAEVRAVAERAGVGKAARTRN